MKSIFLVTASSSNSRSHRTYNNSSGPTPFCLKLANPFEKENLIPSMDPNSKNAGFIRSKSNYVQRKGGSFSRQTTKLSSSRDQFHIRTNNSEIYSKKRTQDICFQILKEKQRQQELCRIKMYGPDIMRFIQQNQFYHSTSDYFTISQKERNCIDNGRRVFTQSIQIYGYGQSKPFQAKRFQKRSQTQEFKTGGGKGKIKKILSWNSQKEKALNYQQKEGYQDQNSKQLPSFGTHQVTPTDFCQSNNKFEKMKSSLTLNSIVLSSKRQNQDQDFQGKTQDERVNLADCYQSKNNFFSQNNFQEQAKRSTNRSSGFFQKKRERGDPFKMSYRSQNSQIIQSNLEEQNAFKVGSISIPQFITFERRNFQLIQL